MSSVASETSIFPPARPLPGPRGPSEPVGYEPASGSFEALLDSTPPREPESKPPETRRAESRRAEAKQDGDRPRDDAAPADSSPRSDDPADVKNTNPAADAETAPADAQAASAEAQATPQSETSPVVPTGLHATSPVLPEAAFLIAVQEAVGAASQQIEQNATGTADTSEAEGTTTDAAVPPAVTAEAALPADSDTAADDVQTSADAALLAPAIAAPAAEAAPVVLTTAALSEAATAPAPAGMAPEAVQPAAAPAPAAEAQAAIAAATGNAKPIKPATDAEPSKAGPETSAATPGDDAPAEGKPELPPLQAARHDRPQSEPEDALTRPTPSAPRAPVPNSDMAADPVARANDAANAVKAGADLVQSLTAPGAHPAPTQSTAAAAAAAAAAPAQTPAAPVPVAGLAVEIAAQALAGKNRFEIRLDPPELGRINVRIEIDSDGHVTSRLVVDRVETLDLLRRDAPQLERALQQAGLKTADNALEFSLRQQAPHQDRNDDAQTTRLIAADDGTASIDLAQHNYGRRLGLGGGIDIRV